MKLSPLVIALIALVLGVTLFFILRDKESFYRFAHRPLNYVNLHWYSPYYRWRYGRYPYSYYYSNSPWWSWRRYFWGGYGAGYPPYLYNQRCGAGYGACTSSSQPCCVGGVCKSSSAHYGQACSSGVCNSDYSLSGTCASA